MDTQSIVNIGYILVMAGVSLTAGLYIIKGLKSQRSRHSFHGRG